MQYYYFEVIKGKNIGERYSLNDGATSLGRSSSNSITIHSNEKGVSGHHAIVYKSPNKILIQDMQSTNGTYLNEYKIQEKEITPNDIIGFGKLGPRMKLIVSDFELVSDLTYSPLPDDNSESQTMRTSNQNGKITPRSSTLKSKHTKTNILKNLKNRYLSPFMSKDNLATIDFEEKLINNQMDGTDLHDLMKKGNRLDKIISRGNLDDAQASLLVSAYKAGKKTRKQWFFIVSGIVGISLIVILFLGIRMLQYKQKLTIGLSLEEKLDFYEKKIFEANSNPDINKTELGILIAELEETKKQLSSVKGELKDNDHEKFFTDETEKKIDEIMVRFGETNYHIPPKMVERVKYHINIYSGRMKKTIGRYLKRKEIYFPMIMQILKEKRLPTDLAYISMLESGFNPKALSHAGARGLWQFMPKTGRTYGLKINKNIDQRLNPKKATYAAAEYFKDLIGIFGSRSSVMLAMAAYNAGEGRIMGALRKIDDPMRNRDFWYIYRMGYLAEETNEYIPRVLALMIIDKHPLEYGFVTDKTASIEETKEDDFIQLDFKAKN